MTLELLGMAKCVEKNYLTLYILTTTKRILTFLRKSAAYLFSIYHSL